MFRPDTLALTGLLAFLAAIGPISTDIFLPSLPAMQRAFATDVASLQATLSIFVFGFALGQPIFGPLSDRRGRKPVVLATLAIYLVGSLACFLAQDVSTMLAGRFVQAIGAAGPIVLARSIVRDLYAGPRAAAELGRMGLITGFVPSLAPLVGSLLEIAFGWHASFLVMVAFAVVGIVLVHFRLPETVRVRLDEPFTAAALVGGFGLLVANRTFVVSMVLMSSAFGGIFAFISGSSFILQQTYGIGGIAYAFAFGAGSSMLLVGNYVTQRLVRRVGADRLLRVGTTLAAVGGVATLVAIYAVPVLLGRPTALAVVIPYMVFMLGIAPILPLSTMRAMAPFPERAGSAASLLGFVQLTSGAVVGALVGQALEIVPNALPLAAVLAVLGLLMAAVERGDRATRRP